ncbi:hypothetical protein KAR91_03600 [Candidatus Pacearchaeota archaeon]|nr:hypothetical protein [Candidatus Pacearchaeota archaeon]
MANEGRPPKSRSKEIDDELKFYFDRGIDEMEVVSRTKHTWRTIHSRYEKWNQLLQDRKDEKFLLEQDNAKIRALAALDKQIVELISLQQIIIKDVASHGENPTFEQSRVAERKALSWMIFDLTDRKTALKLMPSVADKVKQEVKELIAKYQKLPLTQVERTDSQ